MTDVMRALADAFDASTASPNLSRKTGATLITADGVQFVACNTFPEGVRNDYERLEGDARGAIQLEC
jgi:hypothetical protein